MVHYRLMRDELIRLREEVPLSRAQLAKKLGVTPRAIARYESGERAPEIEVRRAYAIALGCTVTDLNAAIRNEKPPGTYHAPRSGFDMLTTMERSCHEIRTVELSICPGLLQTPEYARAVETRAPEQPSVEEVDRRVAERVARQAVLSAWSSSRLPAEAPLRFVALLDRSILERQVGGPGEMDDLWEHLREMNTRPNVEIRLLSEAARLAVARGPFKLIVNENGQPFMVVTEDQANGYAYRDGASVVDIFHELWSYLWSVSSEVP